MDDNIYNAHMVSAYTRLNINEVLSLPCDLFLLYLKNAYIEKMLQTEEGRKQLQDYKRLHTEEADINGLQKFYKVEERG